MRLARLCCAKLTSPVKRAALGACVLMAVAGCGTLPEAASYYRAAGDGPNGGFGWRQIANSDGTVTLKFYLPDYVGASAPSEFWDRRAREICGHGDYKKTIYRVERGYGSNYYNQTLVASGYLYEGYLDCKTQTPPKP
jgi:hypothetical protein